MACRSGLHRRDCWRYCWPRRRRRRKARREPTGIWLTQAGDARVSVSKCGGGICGVIVWLREPIDPATGRPQVDDKNPNPALDSRPIDRACRCFQRHAVRSAPSKWSGQIYNADDGGTYASSISLAGTGHASRRRLRRRALRRRDLDAAWPR